MKNLLGKLWQNDIRPGHSFNQTTLTKVGITSDKTRRLLKAGYIEETRRRSEVGAYYQWTKAGQEFLFS